MIDKVVKNISNQERLTLFEQVWERSVSAQLLLPNINEIRIELGKSSGDLASIAYCAWSNNTLTILDDLLQKFEIPKKGSKDFKRRLSENWLEKGPESRRNVANNVMAAIAELSLANYFQEQGFKILNLEAYDSNSPDILYETNNRRVFCEVKYFEDSPEFYEARIEAAKGAEFAFCVPIEGQTLNYFFTRIAEAVIQSESYKRSERKVCLVFHEIAVKIAESRFILENNLTTVNQWYQDENGEWPGIIVKHKQKILSRTPNLWLRDANTILVATMKDFEINDVKEYQQ